MFIINKTDLTFKNNKPFSDDIFAKFKTSNYYQPMIQQNATLKQLPADKFIKTNNISKKDNALIIGCFILASGLLTLAAISSGKFSKAKHTANKAISLSKKQINIFEVQMKAFPKDIEYRKTMLKDLGLKPKDYHRLRPIVGEEEFTSIVKKLETDKMSYTPGKLRFVEGRNKVDFEDFRYKDNHSYRANLHLHTRYSDGQLTVSEVLEQAVKYADEVAEKNPSEKNPFVLAITDHDAVEGCKEAIDIISKNPWKYRNLKIVLGIENTTVHKNNNLLNSPAEIHLLTYGINPVGKDFKDFLVDKLINKQQNIKNVLESANNKFRSILAENNFNYNFADAIKIAPSFEFCIKGNGNYFMKDFLQFRLIYANTIENNLPLINFMKQSNIDLKDLHFEKGKDFIQEGRLDYSKGQKYWNYYYEGLKKYIKTIIKEKNPNVDENQLASKFTNISPEISNTLESIEQNCLNPNSNLHIKPIPPLSFSNTVAAINSFEHGIMGMAHPGVLFPTNCMKNDKDMPELMHELYAIFLKEGKDKAKFSEDYYQVYFKNQDRKILESIFKISSNANLLKTGGLDTHGKSIFKE
ncbi:MAG: hypothetical protein PHV68_04850 [Candidatus Gastranaerophilales bacterium]|nr:hypothetical protein [Candidatus Gastranaerophilales bacterium]